MAERVIVNQDSQFRTIFKAADPEDFHADEFEIIEGIHQLTPYGMLLASIASCTALVLHTFAQNHDIKLQDVEIHMSYDRVFRDDCENCEEDEEFSEEIGEKIRLNGDLSQADRDKLMRIAHHCPIYQMVIQGIPITTSVL
jgi:putative redox protein